MRSRRGTAWKWVGLAGVAGVAATGVVVARAERERRSYTPDDVRARLHERARVLSAPGESGAGRVAEAGADVPAGPPKLRERLRRFFVRWRRGSSGS